MQSAVVAATALRGWPVAEVDRWRGSTVPLQGFVAMAERSAGEAGDDLLGWTLGSQYDLRQLGPLYQALDSARNLGSALRLFADYFALVQDASEFSLQESDGFLTISYRILDPEIWPRHQDAIFTLGIVAQLVHRACGPLWDKAQIGLECADAERASRLALRAGVDCAAGCDSNWLSIPASCASFPLPRAAAPGNRATAPAIRDLRELDRLLVQKRRTTSVEARVRALVFRQLGGRHISQDEIARQLGMSSRTLRRHLAATNTSFQALVDDCRLRQAAHEFRVRRKVSIAQTALRLGYSEHSTFTRAFSRWSGMPPQAFIRAHAGA